jgi:hypothetical protein
MADVTEYREAELIRRAIMTIKLNGRRPLWALVVERFALGSTYAAQLCRIHGFNPDAMKWEQAHARD